MRRRCLSDKCARSCSCMCPRCRQLAAFPLPPGAPWASRQPSRLKSHRTPRFAGSRGAGHRARTCNAVDYQGHAAAAHGARIGRSHPASRPARHTRRRVTLQSYPHALAARSCTLPPPLGAAMDRPVCTAGQATTLGKCPHRSWRAAPAPARAPFAPLRPARAALEPERENGRATGNGAGHAKQTQLRSRGPGACSAPTGMGGPWTTTHRVAAGAKLRSFESIMAASVV